jgi:PAS domain S-box-containing protein
MPYMRRLAEQKNDLIIDTDPNGIVILDEKLNIVSMNPAFRKMFFCSDMIIGKRISTLVDPDSFEHVSINTDAVVKKTVKYPQYNLICNQTHFAIKESQQIIGIFDNITDSFKSQGELKKLKVDTVTRAQELIDHQIAMAQEMARFLGESVAEGEMLMNKLINSIDSKTDQ